MQTAFLLLAQYDGQAVVPIGMVCRDYFAPLTVAPLMRKIGSGEIRLPVVRMEASQKGAKGVHVEDLAAYIDNRRAAAVKECALLVRWSDGIQPLPACPLSPV
ncbi:pyocin activator PrtN family protein [Burkholderia sp. A1]|uniref:pyocin activator PrtN family protein n=1 Tax=Burkholderia sp. A1 TaxID=148446 RepID=UPI000A05BDE2|nr:pyocin activator PrtN family protein [Burkholderia sp. A1]